MKLVKLSLAAVVAAGSFSFANAVALDEAIQNVDLSGYLRYRYDSLTYKANKQKVNEDTQAHKYKAKLNFSSDIADNFKANVGIVYGETKEKSYAGGQADTETGFAVQEAYLTYTNYDTSFLFGRLPVGAIWTDDLYANGLKVLNNSIEGLTLAAYAFDNYNNDGDYIFNGDTKRRDNNIYGVAAIGSFNPVDFQAWVAYMNKVGTLYAADVVFNMGDKEDFAYTIHGQYAGSALSKGVKNAANAANGNFFGIETGFNAFGADFGLGYVSYGKKDKLTVASIEDKGALMSAGEIVMDGYQGAGYNVGNIDIANGKKDFVFGTIGYTYSDVRFGVDLVTGKVKTADGKIKLYEVTPRLAYKYSDKLKFSSYYAIAQAKKDNKKSTAKKIRLEAQYSF